MRSTTTNLRLDERKLRRIIKEELLASKMLSKPKLTKAVSNSFKFDRQTVVSMLESGFFTMHEEAALKALFKHDRFQRLNESTVRRLDMRVKKLVKESSLLSESIEQELYAEAFGDFFKKVKEKVSGAADTAKDTLSAFYAKAKEALAGGWEKLKKIWSQLKEVVKEICNLIVEGFKKAVDFAIKQAKSFAQKNREEAAAKIKEVLPAKEAILKTELTHFSSMKDFWQSTVYDKFVAGGEWIQKVVDGEGGGGAPDMPSETKTESAGTIDIDFGDAFVLNEIYNGFRRKNLNEISDKQLQQNADYLDFIDNFTADDFYGNSDQIVDNFKERFGSAPKKMTDEDILQKVQAKLAKINDPEVAFKALAVFQTFGHKLDLSGVSAAVEASPGTTDWNSDPESFESELYHGLHLTSLIKNKTGKKIVERIMTVVEWVMSPVAMTMKLIFQKYIGPKILNGIAQWTAKIGGPPPIEYVVLSFLMAETITDLLDAGGIGNSPLKFMHATIAWLFPPLEHITHLIQYTLIGYACVNLFMNLIDMIGLNNKIRKSAGLDHGHGQGGQAKAAH